MDPVKYSIGVIFKVFIHMYDSVYYPKYMNGYLNEWIVIFNVYYI